MSEDVQEKAQGASASTEKKVIRRGVGSARGTTRLKFTHELAKQNGLFIGHLESVVVSSIKIGEESTGMPSFNGLEIPRIAFTFASNDEDQAKRRYVTQSFTAVESNANTIPGGSEEWKVNAVFDWFKHILNVFVLKGRELTQEEEVAYALPFTDFTEEGEYDAIEPETVIEGWKQLFENIAAALNTGRDGNAVFTDKNGKFIPIWMKLIRYIKNNKKGWQPVNNGDLAFPTFVGEGCIELYKANVPPTIRLDYIKEAIIPMKIDKPKAPNMPAMGAAHMGMGVDAPMTAMPGLDAIQMQAQEEDMPF